MASPTKTTIIKKRSVPRPQKKPNVATTRPSRPTPPSDGKRDRSYQRREGGPLARPEPTTRKKVLSFEKLEAMRKGNLKGVNGNSARKKAPGKRK